MLPTEYPCHRPEPSTLYPCPAWFSRPWFPFFGGDEGAIGNARIPAQLLLVIELGPERSPKLQEHPGFFPLLQPSPTRTGAAIPPGQLTPLGTRPENPQDALGTAP